MVPETGTGVEAAAAEAGEGSDRFYRVYEYLASVFGNGQADLVEVLGDDWLSEARKRNRDALRQRTAEILRERDVAKVTELSPNLAMQILTLAQDESRPELIELWARLLANAMDPSRSNVRQSFIATIKRMDPHDAMIIRRMVYRGYRTIHDGPPSFNGTTIPVLATELNTSDDSVFVSLDHLESLGVLAFRRSSSLWRATAFGRELLRACYRFT